MTNSKIEESQNDTKRRLLLLILLLAITIMLCSMMTYAWFTSNKRVSVDELQVNVSAVNGLEISADAVKWGTKIDKNMLINSDKNTNNQLPEILSNVSTAGYVNNGVMDMFYGEVKEINPEVCDEEDDTRCYTLSGRDISSLSVCGGEKACPDNARFMAFDVYLKLDGTFDESGVDLYLTPNANVVKAENENDYGIKNTARVAFIEEGHISKDTYLEGVDVDGQKVAGDVFIAGKNEGTRSIIWEPNANTHTSAGLLNAEKYGLEAVNGKFECKGIKKPFTDIKLYDTYNSAHNDVFENQVVSMQTDADRSTDIRIENFKLKVGVTKLRIYFWVEGQDIDTENNAAGYKMSLNLQFTIK